MDLATWWTTTFGKWEWSNFWSFMGVAANVGLGWIAVKALRASQIQAKAAEKQMQQFLEDSERSKLQDERLKYPSIYPLLTSSSRNFALSIVNGSQFPIIIEDVRFNGMRSRYPDDTPLESFTDLRNGILSCEAAGMGKILKPGEGIELLTGSYWEWIQSLQFYEWGKKIYDRHLVSQRRDFSEDNEYRYTLGINEFDKIDLLNGPFKILIPFAYISPEAKSFRLEVTLSSHDKFDLIALEKSRIYLSNEENIFSRIADGMH